MSSTSRGPFRNRYTRGLTYGLLAAVALGALWLGFRSSRPDSTAPDSAATPTPHDDGGTSTDVVRLPRESWTAAGIEFAPARLAKLDRKIELTGKITLNEDRVAHIFPLVEGCVEEVKVQYGDKVKKGGLLVVVQSKEVGQMMLQLFQDRLQLDFAIVKDRWVQEATTNATVMLDLIRRSAPIEQIERQLADRPMGEYRDRLMSAYVAQYKSSKQLERLAPLSAEGAVTGKQLLEAQTDLNAANATTQSLVEQIQHDAQQAAATSAQSLKELQTRVAVDETNLRILGFRDDDLARLDPVSQGEAVAHYPVYAPFDGTVISKDVALLERVGPDRQILSVADLSTVWVTADVYEEHLPLLAQSQGRTIRLRSKSWPGRTFDARIFYAGDLVDEASRTVAMRAVADNAAGLLKPGMFVNVEFPGSTDAEVLQIPAAALQDYEGRTFVFVKSGDDEFRRRDVTLGLQNDEAVEIVEGLARGDEVVVKGGFVLKSQMLASLLAE